MNKGVKMEGWLQIEYTSIILKPEGPETLNPNPGPPTFDHVTNVKNKYFVGEDQPGKTSRPLSVTGDFLLLLNANRNHMVNPKWQKAGTVPCMDCFYFRLSGLNL